MYEYKLEYSVSDLFAVHNKSAKTQTQLQIIKACRNAHLRFAITIQVMLCRMGAHCTVDAQVQSTSTCT